MDYPFAMLNRVCYYVLRSRDDVFIFPDKKACILYYVPFHSLVYLIGDFDGTEAELRAEILRGVRSILQ